jgi:hypothetical protein
VVSYSPVTPAGKILRAAAFLVAGLVMVRESEQVFELAVLIGAAYILYYAISELIAVAAPSDGALRDRPAPSAVQPLAARLALRVGSLGALAAAAFGGVFITCQALETAEGDIDVQPEVTTCNGAEELCDRRLDEVAFLGTHNSMSAAAEPGWYFAEHYSSIGAQLEGGVRALLIDTWYGYDTGQGVRSADRNFVESKLPPGEFREEVIAAANRLAGTIGPVEAGDPLGTYLCHAFCELGATPLAQALRTINEFVEANPGEVVLHFIQDQNSAEDTAKAFIASGLVKHVYRPVQGETLPTLRTMIERDERVVVLSDNPTSGVDWYVHAWDWFAQDTVYSFTSPARFTCQPNRGRDANPIFVLNHWITARFPSPTVAAEVNSYEALYSRARECEQERGRRLNVVVVDFVEVGDARLVVDALNGVVDEEEEVLGALARSDDRGP